MIIVWGAVVIKQGELEKAKTLSLEHVNRSREEPGCISHAVFVDIENPDRLIFNEEWQDMEALQTHFQVPDSKEFVGQIAALAVSAPTMKIFNAEEILTRQV